MLRISRTAAFVFALGLITGHILFDSPAAWSQETVTDQENEAAETVNIGEAFQMDVPESWIKKEPRSQIVQYEFAQAAAEGDEVDGRIVMMGAGGSVEANIDRWVGQFVQPDGSDSKQRAKVTKSTIAEQTVHRIDISGTYKDRTGGPMGPAVERPNYRMLGAVIVTDGSGRYFVKLYGPAKTVAAGEASFDALIGSLRAMN